MRIGVFVPSGKLEAVLSQIRGAADAGFASAWMPQIFGLDALTALAIVGREVQGIDLGTSVVPTYPRHPVVLAGQALTAQVACGGRLTLGIGLSHQVVIEGMFGYSFNKPARHMREYLSVLMPLLRGESVGFTGETLTANATVSVPDAGPVPVVVAALGERMLKLAGAVADGTVTWMTGPSTVASHIVPVIGTAARAAGRPDPRIVVALPVCVTDDVATAREKAAGVFAVYGGLPSYRAMLDREGAEGPADVAIVGSESEVRAQIERIAEAGATEFVAATFENRERTLECVQGLLARV